jgi:hypothetical protein
MKNRVCAGILVGGESPGQFRNTQRGRELMGRTTIRIIS